MYLAKIEIANFRIFGSASSGKSLMLELQPGVNLIVGANDSGKTCIIDAIRLLIGTVTNDYFRIGEDDFHFEDKGTQAEHLRILGEFRGLDKAEAGAFLEWLGIEKVGDKSEYYLRMWVDAERNTTETFSAKRRSVHYEVKAGTDEEGKRINSRARELLRATYLKPLRDAVNELAARKGSRLSRVLRAYPQYRKEEQEDRKAEGEDNDPSTLVGIMRKAESELQKTELIRTAENDLNTKYLTSFSLGENSIQGKISPGALSVLQILERMELALAGEEINVNRGLGIYNLLFMATELLALNPSEEPELPIVLIEEPEAHLEPQRQLQVMEALSKDAKVKGSDPKDKLQILLTSHSPNLASKVALRSVILMCESKAYPMGAKHTKLEQADYEFLERFLDVTKANLFFARGVILVEGDSEALLLPTLAELIGRPLTKYGVSIVNVGHVGFFRYARIFQRTNGDKLPIPVAYIRDRDIPPDDAKDHYKKTDKDYTVDDRKELERKYGEHGGGCVKGCVAEHWTFEYNLAFTELGRYVHAAVSLAKKCKDTNKPVPVGSDACAIIEEAFREYSEWTSNGTTDKDIAWCIYEPLAKKQAGKPQTAQCLAQILPNRKNTEYYRKVLPSYLVDAIDHVTGKATEGGNDASS